MSETTNKMRDVAIYSDSLIRVRDLTADAIEAVEAQVAEAAARVAALEKKFVTTTDKIEPAPSAVPEPRGFRVGDVVRHREFPGEDWTVSEVMEGGGLIHCTRPRGWVFRAESRNLTLVRAAAAPEAPAEAPTTRPTPAMELDALRGEVARLTKERDEARAISAATAERVRNETQIATELRKDLADANDRLTSQSRSIEEMHAEMVDLRAKLAAAEQALDVERRTMIVDAAGTTHVCKTREDCLSARTMFHANLATARDERYALRAELDEAKKWRDEFKRIGQAAEAELATLKAKPRFRTRKVTKDDVYELMEHKGTYYESCRALGFRRRVDGAK